MKLFCRACQQRAEHTSAPVPLKRPRRLKVAGEIIVIRETVLTTCNECGNVWGEKKRVNR